MGYLDSKEKNKCSGCEACRQICPKNAIQMKEDEEGFRYPVIDKKKCINCGLCKKVCLYEDMPKKNKLKQEVFGGYHKDWDVRERSTSGGAFSAIADIYCDKDYVIFGAVADKTNVYHTYIEDKKKIDIFRKSKYLQSNMNDCYKNVKKFLSENKKVLFSGTPCQIAGLKKYLLNTDTSKLLTVEVICEGVPSPKFVRKLDDYLLEKYNSRINELDYRYKDSHRAGHAKWDFQVMRIKLANGKILKKDRWVNPYWNIWLSHLMSRPSCYNCPFATRERVADITLGDLWGVHIYCPELYGKNSGTSLIIANSLLGKKIVKELHNKIIGHYLNIEEAIKYQSPMRKSIAYNENRDDFMRDLISKEYSYKDIVKKWYKKPTIKLLWSKYVWGNRQKVFLWNIKNKGGKYD